MEVQRPVPVTDPAGGFFGEYGHIHLSVRRMIDSFEALSA